MSFSGSALMAESILSCAQNHARDQIGELIQQAREQHHIRVGGISYAQAEIAWKEPIAPGDARFLLGLPIVILSDCSQVRVRDPQPHRLQLRASWAVAAQRIQMIAGKRVPRSILLESNDPFLSSPMLPGPVGHL